ncbi:MAG: hypothetical protein JWP92_3631 [Caulobacter sp.]|nr:hypothetical protein [Caulobacter sp.]
MIGLFNGPFATHARRVAIWEQAARIPGCDKAVWRCDDDGRVIRWDDYRDSVSAYGWTISERGAAGWLSRVLGGAAGKPMHWRGRPAGERSRAA